YFIPPNAGNDNVLEGEFRKEDN
ncbi:MAG: hypothetical protein RL674_216, partial [Pseudomonadota bacterium]